MAELTIVAIKEKDFSIIKGDDKDVEFEVKDATPANVDVSTGYKARLQARFGRRDGALVIIADETDGLTLADGKITFSILAADSALLNVGRNADGSDVVLPYELEITKTGNPDQVKTIASGNITIKNKLVGKVPVTSVFLDESTLSLKVGGTDGSLTAIVLPALATMRTVVWASSDTNIATVSGGTVTPVAEGTCTITATADEVVASCVVTVVFVHVTSVTLDKETLSLTAEGATDTLVATVLPVDASAPTVTWTSSDTNIATVSGGTVTPVAEGTCTITATADGKTDTCVVAVAKAG